MSDELLTPEEVAKRLKVSPKSIRHWLRTDKLKGARTGRLWRIREDDLQAFLSAAAKPKVIPWDSLTREERLQRISEIQEKWAGSAISVDDFQRRKREEIEEEERKTRMKRGRKSAFGFLADVPGSVEDFMREKYEEVEEEERRLAERHKT